MSSSGPPPAFLEMADDYGIAFEADELERLDAYLDRLLATSEQFNLTAVRDPQLAWTRHVFDSLTLMPWITQSDARSVVDVGTGGGLPGVPLAIVLPDVSFVLLEATGKKAAFLRSTAAELGLENVRVVNERAETAGRDREHHRERYDVVTARAVGPLPVLLELTVPLARVEGLVLAIKGRKAPEEVQAARQALHLLHAEVMTTQRTPTGTVVVIGKRRATPKAYPRRPGEPKRAPLGGRG